MSHPLHRIMFTLSLLACSTTVVIGQAAPAQWIGQRVRVTTGVGRTVGVLTVFNSEDVNIQASSNRKTFALSEISLLEISRARPSQAGQGAILGAAALGLAGVFIGRSSAGGSIAGLLVIPAK